MEITREDLLAAKQEIQQKKAMQAIPVEALLAAKQELVNKRTQQEGIMAEAQRKLDSGEIQQPQEAGMIESALAGFGKQATFGNLTALQAGTEQALTPKVGEVGFSNTNLQGKSKEETEARIKALTPSELIALQSNLTSAQVDEILRIKGIDPQTPTFQQSRDEFEASQAQLQDDNPLSFGAGELGGLVTSMGALSPIAPAKTMGKVGRLGFQAATGAGFGALSSPEDEQGLDVGARLGQAKTGAIFGAGMEGATQAKAVGRQVYGALPQNVQQAISNTADKITNLPRKAAQSILSVFLNVPTKTIEKYVKNIDRINSVKSKQEFNEEVETFVSQLKNDYDNSKISRQEAKEAFGALRNETRQELTEAQRKLDFALDGKLQELKNVSTLNDLSDDVNNSLTELRQKVIAGSKAAREELSDVVPEISEIEMKSLQPEIELYTKGKEIIDLRHKLLEMENAQKLAPGKKISPKKGLRILKGDESDNPEFDNLANEIKTKKDEHNRLVSEHMRKMLKSKRPKDGEVVETAAVSFGDRLMLPDGRSLTNNLDDTLKDGDIVRIAYRHDGTVYKSLLSINKPGETRSLNAQSIIDVIKNEKDKLGVRGVRISDESQQAARKLNDFVDSIEQISEQTNGKIELNDVKNIIQELDRDIDYLVGNGNFYDAKNGATAKIRGILDKQLKGISPEYANAMVGVAKDAETLSTLGKSYKNIDAINRSLSNINSAANQTKKEALIQMGESLGKDYRSAIDKASKIKKTISTREGRQSIKEMLPESKDVAILKEQKTQALGRAGIKIRRADKDFKDAQKAYQEVRNLGNVSEKNLTGLAKKNRRALESIGRMKDKDFVQWADDLEILEAFTKDSTRGSKGVNLWTILVGGATGAATGGLSLGPMAIGSSIGALIDRFGPQMTKKIIDTTLKVKRPTVAAINRLKLPNNVKSYLIDQLPKQSTKLTGDNNER